MSQTTDRFNRAWITENAIDICNRYENGILTLRALHYQLVSRGMTNTTIHYKRVVSAMIKARRDSLIAYEQFSDHEREMIGRTDWESTDLDDEIQSAKESIDLWMRSYFLNRWENQITYLEVWIEKKALQGVFSRICSKNGVALCPCKGYPSLTFLNDAAIRFSEAARNGKNPVIVYFGDHDPSGEDIPRSLGDNLAADFGVEVSVDVRALKESQCLELSLPAAPAKKTDSRTKNFQGLGQIELDAVPPEILMDWAKEAIGDYFDPDLYKQLKDTESAEREDYRSALREYVASL